MIKRAVRKIAFVLLVSLLSVFTPQSFAQTEIFVPPPQGCSDVQWLKRAFLDTLYRQPTQAEINHVFGGDNGGGLGFPDLFGGLISGRNEIALAIMLSDEYRIDVIGGNPGGVQGYYQKLLDRSPTAPQVQADLVFLQGQLVGPHLPFFELMFGRLINNFWSEYRARALALNPGLAECNPDRAIVNQIYLDVVRRPATNAELVSGAPAVAQGNAASLADSLWAQPEYKVLVVKDAYKRFLHRAPTQQELNTYMPVLVGGGFLSPPSPDELLYAFLMSSPEYCTGVPPDELLPLQAVVPAPFLEGETFFDTNALLAPPVQIDGLAAANASVLALNGEVNNQQQAIRALASTLFGDPPTLQVAQAARDEAVAKVAQAAAKLGNNNQQVRQAKDDLLRGNTALTASDYPTAVNRFRQAFNHATNALR